MALIVTCKDLTDTIEVLHQITKAIENNKITDWEKVGTNHFQNSKTEYRDRACFSPTIKDNKLYFGLINSGEPPCSITQEIYDDYHSMFYSILVKLSWRYFFTVEQTPDRLLNIDAKIS
ncbi:MAG: hypothetical protein ABSF43_08670 [Rectinemataceae bacterium]